MFFSRWRAALVAACDILRVKRDSRVFPTLHTRLARLSRGSRDLLASYNQRQYQAQKAANV